MTTQTASLFKQMQAAFAAGPDALVAWLYQLKFHHPTVNLTADVPMGPGYDADDDFDQRTTMPHHYLGTVVNIGVDFDSDSLLTFYFTLVVPRIEDPVKVHLCAITSLDVVP